MHLFADRIVEVDVAGRAPNRMLRCATNIGLLVLAFIVVLLLHGGSAHADEAPPVVPIDDGPLLSSVLEPVVAPIDSVVAPVSDAVSGTATELDALPATHDVESLLIAAITPVAQVPVIDPAIDTVVDPVIDPVMDAVASATSGLLEVAAPAASIVEPTTKLVQSTLFVEDSTTLFEPPAAGRTGESTPTIAPARIVLDTSDVSPSGQAATGAAVVAPATDRAGIDRAAEAPAHDPSIPFAPATPTPSAPGPSSGGVLHTAGHDVFIGALLAPPATGGTQWWLFVTAAFGWRSALVLTRLERPG